eukprot:1757913-Rhodomonas_salina.3
MMITGLLASPSSHGSPRWLGISELLRGLVAKGELKCERPLARYKAYRRGGLSKLIPQRK